MRKFGIFTFVSNAETLTVSNEVKNEVKDMFTSEEWNLMYDEFNGYGLSNEIVNGYGLSNETKESKKIKEINLVNSIIHNCMDGINYSRLDEKWKVDKDVFMKKLESLNYDKALAVYEIVDDYWNE